MRRALARVPLLQPPGGVLTGCHLPDAPKVAGEVTLIREVIGGGGLRDAETSAQHLTSALHPHVERVGVGRQSIAAFEGAQQLELADSSLPCEIAQA